MRNHLGLCRDGLTLSNPSEILPQGMDDLLARAVVHRDRTAERYGETSFQFNAAQRAVTVIEGSR